MPERLLSARLTVVDWFDAAVALPHVLATTAMVRLVGLRRTATALLGRPLGPTPPLSEEAAARWLRRAVAIRRVAARLPDTACLVRSIALAWWMRRHGLPAEVAAGMPARAEGRESRTGHAWVEVGGRRFDDPADAPDRFVPIDLGMLLEPVARPDTVAPVGGRSGRSDAR